MKLCECGCGLPAPLASKTDTKRGWKKGHPIRFINGHNNAHEGKLNSKTTKTCKECGKEFDVWPSQLHLEHCSNKCASVHKNDKIKTKDGDMRKTSNGYLQIKDSKHPYADAKGYVMLHRWVVEQSLGRFLPPEYDVHHKNEIKTDNRLENLEIMTHSEHMSLHANKRWKERPYVRWSDSRRVSQVEKLQDTTK